MQPLLCLTYMHRLFKNLLRRAQFSSFPKPDLFTETCLLRLALKLLATDPDREVSLTDLTLNGYVDSGHFFRATQ